MNCAETQHWVTEHDGTTVGTAKRECRRQLLQRALGYYRGGHHVDHARVLGALITSITALLVTLDALSASRLSATSSKCLIGRR